MVKHYFPGKGKLSQLSENRRGESFFARQSKAPVTAVLLCCALLCGLLTGCGLPEQGGSDVPREEPPIPADAGAAAGTASGANASGGAGGESAAGARPSPQARGPAKTKITVVLPKVSAVLDPRHAGGDFPDAILCNIYEPLYRLDGGSLEPVPCLASNCRMVDELTWEFTLREGVRFHDGSLFTADDALYSLHRYIGPSGDPQDSERIDSIALAEKTADNALRIITHRPDPVLLKKISGVFMVSRAFAEGKSPDAWKDANGTGPYRLATLTADENISGGSISGGSISGGSISGGERSDAEFSDGDVFLTRNEFYWGDQPALEKALFRFVENAKDRADTLIRGRADLAVDIPPEYTGDFPAIFTGAGSSSFWIRFNQRGGIMADRNLRLAANYAIDPARLANDLFGGYAAHGGGQAGREGYFGYSAQVSPYGYDKEKAISLLAETAYQNEPIRLLSVKGRWAKDGELTEAVAAMLRDAGFNIQTEYVGWLEWLDAMFDPKKAPDMQLSRTANPYFDMDGVYSLLLHRDGDQSAADMDEYNALIDAARTEMDPARRRQMYDNLALMLYDDPFCLWLPTPDILHGGAAGLRWTPRPDGRILLAEMFFS